MNVFDIMQGVSINIFVKTGNKKPNELGKVLHFDLFGKREEKYEFLLRSCIKDIPYKELSIIAPSYLMTRNNLGKNANSADSFILSDFFIKYGMGIATGDDKSFISFKRQELDAKFQNPVLIKEICYRLFDKRFIYYDNSQIERGRKELMAHLLPKDNFGLISLKRARNNFTSKFGIVNHIADKSVISTLDNGFLFPLYLYSGTEDQQTIDRSNERKPNLNAEIVNKISKKIGQNFTIEKEITKNTFSPIDILDYIYAILHSPTYREKYKEFLKIDFPRVPYPTNAATFWQLAVLGGELRKIHLLESPVVNKYITQYPVDGDNRVTKIEFVPYVYEPTLPGEPYPDYLGSVKINDQQYFSDVPTTAWNFYIGGYQPAQKWLKDRKGRQLEFEDILHYQQIIVALKETDRIMKEIDTIEIE